ncbi:hypothetical protein F4776DRAFT_659395 [Hypoxylon sp. NC0597]|nr:hypothetical protein F4776DRAFT_659395 [Hypoxylon sp. NC0597]
MQQDVSLQLSVHPLLPIPSDEKAEDLQAHPSRDGVSQHAFGYVCDISKRDWTFRPCGMYNMAWDLFYPYQDLRGGHSLRMNTPKAVVATQYATAFPSNPYPIVHLLTHVGLLFVLFGHIYVYFTHMVILTTSRTLGPISATGNVPPVLYMISIADPGPMAGAANKKDATRTIAQNGLMAVTSLGKDTSNST